MHYENAVMHNHYEIQFSHTPQNNTNNVITTSILIKEHIHAEENIWL